MKAVGPAGPFARAAGGYWTEGWTPIPLPPHKKYPPEKGWTGGSKSNSGQLPSDEVIRGWIRTAGDGNICIRLPKNVIGIDVDMYGDKTGAATLAAAVSEWGELPDTWMTSSRADGSGIRLFRVPPDLSWPGKLPQGGGVELIRWDHRYAICAPSIHPDTGAEYVWVNPAGQPTTEDDGWEFPAIDDLPEMPSLWVDGLTGGRPWVPRDEEELNAEEVSSWLKARGEGSMCEVMERTLALHLQALRKAGPDGGAHDAARDGVWAIIGDSAAGHSGVRPALERMMAAFREAVRGRRSTAERQKEWRSFIEGGVRKVAAEGEPEDEDICAYGATAHAARASRPAGAGSGTYEFTRDDAGNARRFARRYRDAILWVEGLGGWHIWDPASGRWRLDVDGEALRMAMSTVAAMADEAKFIEEEKERTAFRSFIRASSNEARLRSMLSLARAMKGMTAPATSFDADPALFVVGNGTVELLSGGAGVKFRPSLSSDRNSTGTTVRYLRDASTDMWDKFLRRAVPDDEVRDWVQRAAGYSLYGLNPKRLFFMVQGESSSGKSTFGEVLRDVLGPYGAPFELNLLRSQKEQGPNVQLVRLLPRRFVLAAETSAEFYVHADQIKRLTGGEALSARLNRSNEMVERVPAFTPWLVTNFPPTIRGADQALYRRIYTIPFNETLDAAAEDNMLPWRLKHEGAEGVLSWLVAGWKAYAARGLGDVPAGIASATMRTRAELSDFDVWLTEQCVMEAAETAISDELYANYRMWCEDAAVKAESKIEFGRMLGRRGMRSKMVRIDPANRDRKARGWTGVALRSSAAKWS